LRRRPVVTGTLAALQAVEAPDVGSFSAGLIVTAALDASEAADTASFEAFFGNLLINVQASEAPDIAAFAVTSAW
jgi:hypothetical protein